MPGQNIGGMDRLRSIYHSSGRNIGDVPRP